VDSRADPRNESEDGHDVIGEEGRLVGKGARLYPIVITGLGPVIHALRSIDAAVSWNGGEGVDGRAKRGHDVPRGDTSANRLRQITQRGDERREVLAVMA
jgi:hypothetical protein